MTEIAGAFHISPDRAAARLSRLASLPGGDLAFMAAHAPQVRAAAAQLTALGQVPPAIGRSWRPTARRCKTRRCKPR